jgi:hypothetical protein
LSKNGTKVVINFVTPGKDQKGYGAIVEKVQWCNSKQKKWSGEEKEK